MAYIYAIDYDPSAGGVIETGRQVHQRRFAGPGGSDKADPFTGCDGEVYPFQYRQVWTIGKRYVVKQYFAGNFRRHGAG